MTLPKWMVIVLVAILLFSATFLEAKKSTRILIRCGAESPRLEVNNQWADYIQKKCYKELEDMKTELGDYDLYISFKAGKIDIVSSAESLKERRPHQSSTKPQSNLQRYALDCLRKNHHSFPGFSAQDVCTRGTRFPFHLSRLPRRYLADKPHKGSPNSAAGPTSDAFNNPIIIPPDLFFPPPPPATTDNKPTGSAGHNKDMNVIITVAISVLGVVVIFALVLFCCLRKGHRSIADAQKDDKPLLTLGSSEFSSGSSASSDMKNGGRNTGFGNSSIKHGCQPGNSLPGIPENDCDSAANSEEQNSEKQSSPGKSKSKSNPPPKAPPPAAPPPPPPKPKPPPPPPTAKPPPAPPKAGGKLTRRTGSGDDDPDAPRTKLKPFFWDKVVGSPDHSMVWDEIRAGSFQFNEEMIESLFGYNPDDRRNANRGKGPNDGSQPQYIQIIDAKKAQNLSILLKALNVTTEEVRDALLEGNELPAELLQTLLRMAPTQDEELKLRLFNGDISQLGPADRFLKVLVDIPHAFRRMESLLFMMTFKEEVTNIKESFVTLEVACEELKESRLFLKLLEAVLKTGNRMNDGTYRGGAQAFKLDTLLKLADVKGTDGKTTLLHFVVQEIIRSEGLKALRAAKENRSISSVKTDDFVEDSTYDDTEHYRTLGLQVVSSISSELENVKKAANIDNDVLTSTVSKLGQSLMKNKKFLENELSDSEEESGFHQALLSFVEHSEGEVTWLLEEEQRISGLVRKTADYFHGNAGREEGLRLFNIVRDFLLMLDKICTELKQSFAKQTKNPSGRESSSKKASLDQNPSIQDMRQKLFPAIADRRPDGDDSSSSSDDD